MLYGAFSPAAYHPRHPPPTHPDTHSSHPTPSRLPVAQVPTCSGDFKQALVSLLDDVKAGRLVQQPQQSRQPLSVNGTQAAASDEPAEVLAALTVG